MTDQINASIILPCYNEQQALQTVISEIKEAMNTSNFGYEIIIVDDCSTDKTAEIAKSQDVVYFRNEKNIGAGASRLVGIEKSKHDIIVYIDADDSYCAEDIPRLLRHFPHSDHVIGYRDCEMGYFRPLRKFIKAISRYLASILVWEYIADLNTGLRAFKKSKMDSYFHLLPPGFSCVTTLTLISYCTKQKVSYISTHYKKRIGKSKFHPIIDTARLFLMIFKTVLFLKPLRLIVFLAMITGLIVTPIYISNSVVTLIASLVIISSYVLISMYTTNDSMRFE